MLDWPGVRGKRIVITGATNGIGLAAAKQLAARGALLSLVARDAARAQAAANQIAASSTSMTSQPDVLIADLSSQADIRSLASEIKQRYPRLDVLINNAGAVYSTRRLSPDGIELTWALNHLGPFLLTTELLDLLQASAPARIITTSSAAHVGAQIPFDDLNADQRYGRMGLNRYGETKLANILFTVELAHRLRGSGVTANSFHPGFVSTGFNTNNSGLMRVAMDIAHMFARSPEKGAETLVWLADSPEVSNISGAYFIDNKQTTPSPVAQDQMAAQRLWTISEQQTTAATPAR